MTHSHGLKSEVSKKQKVLGFIFRPIISPALFVWSLLLSGILKQSPDLLFFGFYVVGMFIGILILNKQATYWKGGNSSQG